VTLGGTAYLVGGYDGTSWTGTVLATTNGRTFTKVATLPVPVRYAAVAGAGKRIWVFGGLTPAGNSRVIQRVNLATGAAAVVGHLPAPISAATAVTLGGRIFIAGGQVTKGGARLAASRKVLAYDPVHHRVTTAGRLPVAVTNAAAAVIGGIAYLVGGNNGNRQVSTVAQLRLVAA
jgi:N-acetylneuraminic acid mutarotase